MEELQIARNNATYNKLQYTAPFAALIAIISAYSNFSTGSIFRIFIAILLVLFSILILVFFFNSLSQSRNQEVALVINADGIVDNISMAKIGFVNWNEIEKIEIIKSAGHPHLFFFIKNSEKYLRKLNWFKRRMLLQLEKDKGSPIAINLGLISYDSNELIVMLEKMRNSS